MVKNMSRIGKKPIVIPQGVEVKIDNGKVIIRGPKGEISQEIRPEIKVEVKEDKIFVSPQKDYNPPSTSSHKWAPTKQTKAFWGLTRALIFNMIEGVTAGFEKKLEIQGIGFRAVVEGQDLALYIGYTHPVKIKIPPDIKISVEKNIITVSGINKEKVSQIAAKIKKVKPPEPYKGKGIRYLGEQIRRKVGKKVVTAG
jgi:large subunit ribosomal protein L6